MWRMRPHLKNNVFRGIPAEAKVITGSVLVVRKMYEIGSSEIGEMKLIGAAVLKGSEPTITPSPNYLKSRVFTLIASKCRVA
jgi:hypothetical protein